MDALVVVVCILLLLIGVYSLLDELWLYENALDKSLLIYRPDLDEPLGDDKKISENQVAWLCVFDTDIDYPVMQGADNFEYLNKDPYGEFKLSGSIFLDYRSDRNLTDAYSVIYGHHMERGAMFGALDAFKERDYFDAHRTGRIVTEAAVYDYELFAVAYADAGNQTLFSPHGRTTSEILEYLKQNSLIYTDHEEGRIVALSTCSGDNSLTRLLVFGVIKEQ